jgi:hypothetical protein
MRGLFVVPMTLSLAACSSDSGLKKYNSDPEAFISSHTTGDTVVEGVPETIRGQVGDPNHAIEDLSVTWLLNGTETCDDSIPDGEGVVSCEMTFGTEGGEVSLEVRDPEGAGDSATVTLEVQPTDAPVAEITAPTADGVYYSDQLITFQGTVSDAEDAVDALTVAFETAELGDLGFEIDTTSEGAVEAFGSLDEGEHAVRLRVTDTTGKEGVDSTVITVGPPNSNPTCAITAPVTGSAGPEGELVTFTGTAGDVDVAPDWLNVAWSSDKDGPIGTSTPTTSGEIVFNYDDLRVDTHTITMTVTDEIGATCSDLTVFTVGTPPVLNITAPESDATLNHSDAVVFEATVEDNEDLPNEVALSWESDIDGVFSTDGADSSGAVTVSIDSLSAGDHVVTVTATDTDGLFVTDTVSFNLNQPPTAPTVTLEPDPAATNQMLVATASGSEDPEGIGTVTYAYEWFEDGVASTESSSATFAAAATGKHHTYRVQVTASDGLIDSAFGYAEANVINSEPVLSGPTLSAATAATGDVLTCTASATDIDPEDSPAVTYAWSDATTGPTYTVTMSDAVDGAITCTATANDADGGVVTGTASATVANTAPTVETVAVTPLLGHVGEVLTCIATASDPDGDAPTITYAWSDGSTGSTYTIADTHHAGDIITCTATATDAYGLTGTGTETATVGNTPPDVSAILLTPSELFTNDTLTAVPTVSDAEGDGLAVTYAFSVNGEVVQDGTSDNLSGIAHFDKGDSVSVVVTADDGEGIGTRMSDTLIVQNTPPTEPTASIIGLEGCLEGWNLTPTGDRCIAVFPRDELTWDGAQASCESMGGNLIRIGSAEENSQIVDLAQHTLTGEGSFFIGYRAIHEWSGPWAWMDGSHEMYTNWIPGEPGDGFRADDLHCAMTHLWTGQWNDANCSSFTHLIPEHLLGYACQQQVPESLRCIIDEEATDVDGDAIGYTFAWDVDGTPFTDTVFSDYDDDTVPSDALGYDETWTCEATPIDGEEDGDYGSAEHTTDPLCHGHDSSCPAESCQEILDHDLSATDGVYWINIHGGPTFEAYCDMSTDGGGWLLILSYNHEGGTNPPLNASTLPISVDAGFSHTGTDAIEYPDIDEARFYCTTERHSRVIHFKTGNPHIIEATNNPDTLPTWGPSDWSSGFTALDGHTGMLPAAASGTADSSSLTEFPFYRTSEYHWGIRSWDRRWECDGNEFGSGYDFTTTHQVWVR